ncbi:PAS domain-containing hybrid sensor histidine kinase/response regulator [Labilibaculum antarcticum]|uniref:Sensory/regulatory protein RpfC n=1 Tax=Labilibaculum antarcticum TaxID=1717717 RepID=A0A1Y1CMJ1_9BACT|nr:PAS domain S-box protein [Labilibaculum antarcticum]BAX81638.1 hybrid sensor histidine kinase/response regulator [Labilibaculum antarcticum]
MHRLLKRQVRKYLSAEDESKFKDFLKAVDEAYVDYDMDLKQTENILENCSIELFTLNNDLRKVVVNKTKEVEVTSSKMESIVNSISEVIFQTNFSGEWLYLNSAWNKITGFVIEKSLNSNVFEFIHPDDAENCMVILRDLIESKRNFVFIELRLVTISGSYKWCEATIRVTRDSDGKRNGFTGTLKDITSRKRLEEEKKKTEEKFKLIFEKSSVAYLIIKESRFIECNQACLDLYGVRKREDFIGKYVKDFSPEYQPDGELSFDKAKERIEECKIKGYSKFDWMHVRENGTEFPVEVALNTVPLMDGNVLFVVLNDLSERKRVEQELIIAKEKAEEATSVKAQFLSTMSHEIRTPMNAVIGVTHLLSEDNPREDQIQNINILKLSADNLMTLINDVLDFSKIEAGRVNLESIDFNFRNLVKNIVSGFEIKSREKGLDFIVDIDPKIPSYLIGDPNRISQIINNLCGNAVKFTDSGNVQVLVSYQEKCDDKVKLKFEIKDTGVGIPEDKQDQIFQSFSQADSNTTRLYGGTGLGLTISKKLIEIMGGFINVISDLEFGTTFCFELSLMISHKSKPKLDLSIDTYRNTAKIKGLHILLVEDNEMNILILKQFLKKWGITYEIAMNGQVALGKVQSGNFDMVLMDLQMPILDGYQATQSIRSLADDKFREIPILAITASAFNDIRKRVLEAGMNDYITKPINPEELFRKIEKHMN